MQLREHAGIGKRVLGANTSIPLAWCGWSLQLAGLGDGLFRCKGSPGETTESDRVYVDERSSAQGSPSSSAARRSSDLRTVRPAFNRQLRERSLITPSGCRCIPTALIKEAFLLVQFWYTLHPFVHYSDSKVTLTF